MAALLFKVEASIRLGLNKVASTSHLCAWNKSRRQVDPAPLELINFSRPKKNENIPKEKTNIVIEPHYSIKDISINLARNLSTLKEISPTSAVLSNVCLFEEDCNTSSDDSSGTELASETDDNIIPEPITSLFESTAINCEGKELEIKCDKAFKSYIRIYKQDAYDRLTKLTINPEFFGKLENSQSWKNYCFSIS